MANMVKAATEAPPRSPTWGVMDPANHATLSARGGLVTAERRREARDTLALRPGQELRGMRQDAIKQLKMLLAKTRKAINELPADRAVDHRALASTLIAL